MEDQVREATLVLNLPTDTEKKVVDFDGVLYKGKYAEKLLTMDDIKVITDLSDNEYNVTFKEGM